MGLCPGLSEPSFSLIAVKDCFYFLHLWVLHWHIWFVYVAERRLGIGSCSQPLGFGANYRWVCWCKRRPHSQPGARHAPLAVLPHQVKIRSFEPLQSTLMLYKHNQWSSQNQPIFYCTSSLTISLLEAAIVCTASVVYFPQLFNWGVFSRLSSTTDPEFYSQVMVQRLCSNPEVLCSIFSRSPCSLVFLSMTADQNGEFKVRK